MGGVCYVWLGLLFVFWLVLLFVLVFVCGRMWL